MKNIKLKSLFNEISTLREDTKHTELKELEDILLKAGYEHVKDDAGFSGKATYEKSGEEISLFKDYEEDMGPDRGKTFPVRVLRLAGTKSMADKNYDSLDKAKTELEKMISQDSLKETNIKLDDQGYAASYYNVSSDVITTWDNTKIITQDIKGYLAAAHETGGPKLVREVMNAILAGVNNAKPLLRQLKGTSPADVDLAENETIKLTSFLKEEKHIPFKFGNLDMYIGQQGKYIYVFPKSMRQFDDFMLSPGALSVPEAIESMLDKKGIEVTKVSAPSNVPGFAFVSKASLEDIAKALGTK